LLLIKIKSLLFFCIEIHLPDIISKISLDPFGRLVLVATRDKRECFIAVSSASSLKLQKKTIRTLANQTVPFVSATWCNRFIKQTESVALLATKEGNIYEISIQPNGDLVYCTEVYPGFKSVMETYMDSVTGIYCDVKTSYEDSTNVFVVVTTQKAIYYFENTIDPTRKSDIFLPFFGVYRDASVTDLKYREFPSVIPVSEIQLYSRPKSSTSKILQRQFAWITGAGLYYTEIDPNNVQKSFLERSRIIDYGIDIQLRQNDNEEPPRSVALTEFHCLMMFPNENLIRGMCTVNQKVIMIDGSMEVQANFLGRQ